MHAFWTVLLIPMSVIAARLTLSYSQKTPSILPNSAATIWKLIFGLVTAMVVLVVLFDVVMFCFTNTKYIAAHPIFMRAIFRLITSVDFPLVQLWIGSLIAFLICRRAVSLPHRDAAVDDQLMDKSLMSSASVDHTQGTATP